MNKFLESPSVKTFKHQDKEQILQYIPLIYGSESELVKIEDLKERKKLAASRCEIEVPEDNEDLSKLIIEFLRHEHHNKFALLICKEELFMESLEALREPLEKSKDDDKRLKNIKLKGDLNDLCGKLVDEIVRLRQSIFTPEFAEKSMKVVSIEERLSQGR